MSEDRPLSRIWILFFSTFLFSVAIGYHPSNDDNLSTKKHRSAPPKYYNRRVPSDSWASRSDFNGWSEWTSCSRTCGSGISTRSRICKQRSGHSISYYQCSGDSKQFRLCNIQTCPDGEIDFRQYQCATYNNKEIAGEMTKKWIPVTGHIDCELKCKSTHNKRIYTFGKALDGTKCHVQKDDVCINGRCLPVDCDLLVGSTKTLDECGICGGRNDSCRFISGEFKGQRSRTASEYQEVVFIPAGASKIRVEESSGNNHLALMNSRRHFLVNGDRSLGWPGTYSVAGTTVNYSRSGNDESFSISGPTKEDIHIMVLMYERNDGIRFHYWLPTDRHQNSPHNPSTNSIDERNDVTTPKNRDPNENRPRPHHPRHPPHRQHPEQPARQTPRPQAPENNRIPIDYPGTPRPSIKIDNRRPGSKHFRTYWSYDATTGKEIPQIHFGVTPIISGSTPPSNIHYIPEHYRPDRDGKRKKPKKNKGVTGIGFNNDTRNRNGTCGPCERVTSRVKHFCDSEFVIRAVVLDVLPVGSETRYALEVIGSYKNTVGLLVREFVWANDPCRCPRLRRGIEYILMGRHDSNYRRNETRLLLERTSFTRKFTPKRDLEMQKLREVRNIRCRNRRRQ